MAITSTTKSCHVSATYRKGETCNFSPRIPHLLKLAIFACTLSRFRPLQFNGEKNKQKQTNKNNNNNNNKTHEWFTATYPQWVCRYIGHRQVVFSLTLYCILIFSLMNKFLFNTTYPQMIHYNIQHKWFTTSYPQTILQYTYKWFTTTYSQVIHYNKPTTSSIQHTLWWLSITDPQVIHYHIRKTVIANFVLCSGK